MCPLGAGEGAHVTGGVGVLEVALRETITKCWPLIFIFPDYKLKRGIYFVWIKLFAAQQIRICFFSTHKVFGILFQTRMFTVYRPSIDPSIAISFCFPEHFLSSLMFSSIDCCTSVFLFAVRLNHGVNACSISCY